MSIHMFVCCDFCNPEEFRCPEQRRKTKRGQERESGRRWTDGCSWIDGDERAAVVHGWITTGDGLSVCPQCADKGVHLRTEDQVAIKDKEFIERSFIFCDVCNTNGIRQIELRRQANRGDRGGRRSSDGCAWYGGEQRIAVEEDGWTATLKGEHVCPSCLEKDHYVVNVERYSARD